MANEQTQNPNHIFIVPDGLMWQRHLNRQSRRRLYEQHDNQSKIWEFLCIALQQLKSCY